jgi:hypothetical protein
MLEREGAKASDFDAISPGKCSPDRREDGFDNALDIACAGDVGATLPSFAPVPTLSKQSPF